MHGDVILSLEMFGNLIHKKKRVHNRSRSERERERGRQVTTILLQVA
jgi:hypothetical protein